MEEYNILVVSGYSVKGRALCGFLISLNNSPLCSTLVPPRGKEEL
jgi:hypothetical protein